MRTVISLCRLPDPFAAARAEGLAEVGPVAAGGVAGQDEGADRPDEVGKGQQGAEEECGEVALVLAEVAVAIAVVLDDPALGARLVGGHLVAVDSLGAWDEEDLPARVPEPLAEVGLV